MEGRFFESQSPCESEAVSGMKRCVEAVKKRDRRNGILNKKKCIGTLPTPMMERKDGMSHEEEGAN